jgi:glutamine---fructose-6-phosphate transaminase (isomerizing)
MVYLKTRENSIMCGIIGAIAQREVTEILVTGLKRLEYRGYDSAGIAMLQMQEADVIEQRHVVGKIVALEEALKKHPVSGYVGIAHTRWATHGEPSRSNAHPHCSQHAVSVVHNGIIENHQVLRQQLVQAGYTFHSDTDTEVICHLLHQQLEIVKTPREAIQNMMRQLKGAYGLGIIIKDTPDTLYAVKKGSPLVLGVGIGEHFIASDPIALLPVTQQFVFLEEDDIAEIKKESYVIWNQGEQVVRDVQTSEQEANAINKGTYRHFMLKEIHEQPRALADTLNSHIVNDALVQQVFGHQSDSIFSSIQRVQIVACGTSYHAGLVARHWIESLAKLPCQVDISSEFRYRDMVVEPNTLLVALSQSGETADTLAALEQAKKIGIKATLAICNVAESSLARQSDLVFLTRAGVEIGVAATKTFTAQLMSLILLALSLQQAADEKHHDAVASLQQLPSLINDVLKIDTTVEAISKQFIDKKHALFLGRHHHHAIAMEGALKLKEISYMHAEAYPAGELKHGPLALVDQDMPVIVVAPNNMLFEKLHANIKEVEARGGQLFVIAEPSSVWDDMKGVTLIPMPAVPEWVSPIVYTVPLQLLAYYIAIEKGTDIDQPRNLAKSVTVE